PQQVEQKMRDLQVRPLGASAQVVDFAYPTAREHLGNSAAMIADVNPVPDVPSAAVDRDRLILEQVCNEQGEQLFGKLIWTVVIRAARDERRKPEGMMVGAHKKIGRRLRRRIGAVGRKRRLFAEGAGRSQAAINLIGRDLNKPRDAGGPAGI